MKKRFLLLTLIMCLFGGVMPLNVMAQDEVTITGVSEQDAFFGPFEPFSSYSYEQTIYLKSEIVDGEGNTKTGTIDKITYYVAAMDKVTDDRKLVVYMKEVDDSYFEFYQTSKYENIPVAPANIVYNNTITVSEGELTIDLPNNYDYSGGNLLISVLDKTGSQGDRNMKFTQFSSSIDIENETFYRTIAVDGGENYESYVGATYYMDKKAISPKIKLTFADDGEPETPETLKAPTVVSPTNGTTIGGTTVNLSWRYGENNTATHYQVSLGTDNENLSVITDGWVERTGLGTGDIATEDEFSYVNLEYGNTYYWRVDVRNGEGDPVDGTIWSFATPASAAFEFITEGDWNVGANWNGGAVPGNGARVTLNAAATIKAGDNINVADLTILDGASLTINGSLTITGNKFSNTDASKLVINDGGQIFQTNEGVKATFNMNINNPTVWSENNIDGWQFISSPFKDDSAPISDFVTTGDGNDYDLYKFDGKQVGAEWVNHKRTQEEIENEIPNDFETTFQQGRGYLASYEDAETAILRGTLNSGDTYSWDNLTYNNNNSEDLANFHLIGNPFPFDMDMSKLVDMTYHITEGYAVVNNGSYSYYNLEGTIPAGDGFFVKAVDINPSLYYDHSTSSKSRNAEQSNSLNIIATGNAGNDNVVVNFNGEGEGFPKLQNFNDAIATVYVQNNDVNYAIFNCNEDVQEIELCFNANQMGNYTISVEPTGEFSSIVLVDRFTGIETNLLVEDYHFTAMSEENNNRFFIRLGNSQESTDNSHFAYVSGEDLIIEAEGTVQIIDMMGRVVYTSNVENNNRINVSEFNNGAYVVRVINENEVKVQKIIL